MCWTGYRQVGGHHAHHVWLEDLCANEMCVPMRYVCGRVEYEAHVHLSYYKHAC